MQRILGHTSIKTTNDDVYVHLGEASKRRTMERFGRNYRLPKAPPEESGAGGYRAESSDAEVRF